MCDLAKATAILPGSENTIISKIVLFYSQMTAYYHKESGKETDYFEKKISQLWTSSLSNPQRIRDSPTKFKTKIKQLFIKHILCETFLYIISMSENILRG